MAVTARRFSVSVRTAVRLALEEFGIIIALNGYRFLTTTVGSDATVVEGGKLAVLTIARPRNETVEWSVAFER